MRHFPLVPCHCCRDFSDTPIFSMSGKDEEVKRVQFGARDLCIESPFPLSFHPKLNPPCIITWSRNDPCCQANSRISFGSFLPGSLFPQTEQQQTHATSQRFPGDNLGLNQYPQRQANGEQHPPNLPSPAKTAPHSFSSKQRNAEMREPREVVHILKPRN